MIARLIVSRPTLSACGSTIYLALAAILAVICAARSAHAQTPGPRSEAELLVPPQGGAFEIPVHAGMVCILSFPEKLAQKALQLAGLRDQGVGR
jgi:hypothetical protein